jgi:hypothetical protein
LIASFNLAVGMYFLGFVTGVCFIVVIWWVLDLLEHR